MSESEPVPRSPTRCPNSRADGRSPACYRTGTVNRLSLDQCFDFRTPDGSRICNDTCTDEFCSVDESLAVLDETGGVPRYCFETVQTESTYTWYFVDYEMQDESSDCLLYSIPDSCGPTGCTLNIRDFETQTNTPPPDPRIGTDNGSLNAAFLFLVVPFVAIAILIPCALVRLKPCSCARVKKKVTTRSPAAIDFGDRIVSLHRDEESTGRSKAAPVRASGDVVSSHATVYPDMPPIYEAAEARDRSAPGGTYF